MNAAEETSPKKIEDLSPELQSTYRSLTEEITRAAREAGEPAEFYEAIVNSIQRAFDHYSVNLYIIDPGRKWALLRGATRENMKAAVERGHKFAVEDRFMISRVVHSASPSIGGDAHEQPEIMFSSAQLPPVHAELCFPLLSKTKDVLGVLDMQSIKYCSAFGMDDFIFYMAIADHIANLLLERKEGIS